MPSPLKQVDEKKPAEGGRAEARPEGEPQIQSRVACSVPVSKKSTSVQIFLLPLIFLLNLNLLNWHSRNSVCPCGGCRWAPSVFLLPSTLELIDHLG